jgi:hypothetical protein
VKKSKTLTTLHLGRECVAVREMMLPHWAARRNGIMIAGNKIGDVGAIALADGVKASKTLTELELEGELRSLYAQTRGARCAVPGRRVSLSQALGGYTQLTRSVMMAPPRSRRAYWRARRSRSWISAVRVAVLVRQCRAHHHNQHAALQTTLSVTRVRQRSRRALRRASRSRSSTSTVSVAVRVPVRCCISRALAHMQTTKLARRC